MLVNHVWDESSGTAEQYSKKVYIGLGEHAYWDYKKPCTALHILQIPVDICYNDFAPKQCVLAVLAVSVRSEEAQLAQMLPADHALEKLLLIQDAQHNADKHAADECDWKNIRQVNKQYLQNIWGEV